MLNNAAKQNTTFIDKALGTWYEEVNLPVAPACNIMCNFCSKDSDCICNGNNPQVLSRTMTPRQAINWAISSINKNSGIKFIKITGPGEPLFNHQTFEVLKRLNFELPGFSYGISTNGLLLEEKIKELVQLNVKHVEVSINTFSKDLALKLYSRVIKDNNIIMNSRHLAEMMLDSQIKGVKACIENGISVKINTICFPGINDEEILSIAEKCKEMGVTSFCLISGYPNGKFIRQRSPSLPEMIEMQKELSKIIEEVEIKGFMPS